MGLACHIEQYRPCFSSVCITQCRLVLCVRSVPTSWGILLMSLVLFARVGGNEEDVSAL